MTDDLIAQIADYIVDETVEDPQTYAAARWCLMDSLGCAVAALNYSACTKLLGPVVPGATLAGGARVPGMTCELDPITAAFNIGVMVRWLDFNDTWLAAEWGHPSDNLGAIMACVDYVSRRDETSRTVRDILTAMIKAYEIQGVLAMNHAFNRVGLDHVLLVRVASTAVATRLLGGKRHQVVNALSHAWIDGGPLRIYRQGPHTGSRKSWAAGDATSRAVQLGLITLRGEMGYPMVLGAKTWGFCDVFFNGNPIQLTQSLGNNVIMNILFKVAYPAEFHAQTAVEAALQLQSQVVNRLDKIDRIQIETQEAALRIINKTGPLRNSADRDHCLQYAVAIALLYGQLTTEHYEDRAAADPRIDQIREKMYVIENTTFTRDYLDPQKRAIANALQIFFDDGTCTKRVEVAYPIGHRQRRQDALPLLKIKFQTNLSTRYPSDRIQEIVELFDDPDRLDQTSTSTLMKLLQPASPEACDTML